MTTDCAKTILFDYPAANLLDEVLSQSSLAQSELPAPHSLRRGSADSSMNSRTAAAAPASAAMPSSSSAIGRCLHALDPLDSGRVLVAYCGEAGEELHRWLTPIAGLLIQRDDELLLLQPRGSREPIVAGVLTRRPARPSAWPLELALAAGETLSIVASNGAKLVEIAQQDSGPVVRMCDPNVQVALPGKLRIDAAEIDLHAHAGPVQIESNRDVAVRGAIIRLN
jgi:hypothetical protein